MKINFIEVATAYVLLFLKDAVSIVVVITK